jgi:hypothetical protein
MTDDKKETDAFSTDQGSQAAIEQLQKTLPHKPGKMLKKSEVVRLAIFTLSKWALTNDDIDVAYKEAREEYESKLEGVKGKGDQ